MKDLASGQHQKYLMRNRGIVRDVSVAIHGAQYALIRGQLVGCRIGMTRRFIQITISSKGLTFAVSEQVVHRTPKPEMQLLLSLPLDNIVLLSVGQ